MLRYLRAQPKSKLNRQATHLPRLRNPDSKPECEIAPVSWTPAHPCSRSPMKSNTALRASAGVLNRLRASNAAAAGGGPACWSGARLGVSASGRCRSARPRGQRPRRHPAGAASLPVHRLPLAADRLRGDRAGHAEAVVIAAGPFRLRARSPAAGGTADAGKRGRPSWRTMP
jgi:hypothetical protein